PDGRTLVTFATHVARSREEKPKVAWTVWDVTANALRIRSVQDQSTTLRWAWSGELDPAFLADNKTILFPGEHALEFWDVSVAPPIRRKASAWKDLLPQMDSAAGMVSADGTTLAFITYGPWEPEKVSDLKDFQYRKTALTFGN